MSIITTIVDNFVAALDAFARKTIDSEPARSELAFIKKSLANASEPARQSAPPPVVPPAGVCPQCGTQNASDCQTCAGCGYVLTVSK